jgi:hypothetical protein
VTQSKRKTNTKHKPSMHSQPLLAVFPWQRWPLPLPYKDEKEDYLQMVFCAPYLPAKPIQLGALAAYVAASIQPVQLFDVSVDVTQL